MRQHKGSSLYVITLVLVINSVIVNSTATPKSLEEEFFPSQGAYFKYHLSYERILPSGDFLGIIGNAEINYFQQVNSSHINIELEAIVDLSWIQGKQDLNLTQNVKSRSLIIDDYQGEIMTGVLYYFGNEVRFFNPIYISPALINNKSDVNI